MLVPDLSFLLEAILRFASSSVELVGIVERVSLEFGLMLRRVLLDGDTVGG